MEAFMEFLKPHIEAYMAVVRRFKEFEGRARRREFWMFALYNLIISVVWAIVSGILSSLPFIGGLLGVLFGIVSFGLSIAITVVSFALAVRRFHDTNRSGMTWLFILIPLAGPIIVIVFWAQEGNSGNNQYGSDPKAGGAKTAKSAPSKKGTAKPDASNDKGKTVFCGECGTKNAKGTKFCGSCGKRLT